jgi:plasmid rolling circle replication initiator protein Rep
MWQARFLKALPAIEAAHPTARWLFLTLTVRNCNITDLRRTIQDMNQAWQRLIKRREFDSNTLGWIRTTEVTRGRDDSAHPHFHVLMMVKPGYFAGKNYITQKRWTELWQECARLDYTPIVHVQAVKSKSRLSSLSELPLHRAIAETLKYAVKPSDMHDDWLIELTRQVYHLRFIASGGVLKNVLREGEEKEEDLLLADDPDGSSDASEPDVYFRWNRTIRRYVKR